MNLQPGSNGKAKDDQVRQVLKIYDDLAHSLVEHRSRWSMRR